MSGESGIGKTRLALELAQRVRRRGFGVLAGECLPRGGPLHPLRDVFQRVADRCRERGPEETQRLLGPRGKVLALYEPALGVLPGMERYPDPPELPPAEARARLYTALAEMLAALQAEQPALLLLDDLQWADGLTLGWLEHGLQTDSGRAKQAEPLLILGLYRTEEALEALHKLLEFPRVRGLRLERLEETAIGSMVGDMLALAPPPALFARFLAQRSGGNPFFVAEYLRAAVEERLLYRDSRGLWQVASGEAPGAEPCYEDLPLPHSVGELVRRRLSALSPEGRALAENSAVLGREVEAGLLAEMTGRPEPGLWDALQELGNRQVLEELEAGKLRFLHDQIREVAYEGIPAERRRELHRSAAQAVEARSRTDPEYSAGNLAALGHHWEQAGEPDKAREPYRKAGHEMTLRYAYSEAERLFRAYLRTCPEPMPESILWRNWFSWKILHAQSRSREALEEHRLALAEARRIGDGSGEARSLVYLCFLQQVFGQLDEALQLGEQGLAAARKVGDQRSEAFLISTVASIYQLQGKLDLARTLNRQALALAQERADRLHEGRILGNLATLSKEQGRMEEASALCRESIAISFDVQDDENQALIISNLAAISLLAGRLVEADAFYEQSLALKRKIGDRRTQAHSLHEICLLRLAQGRVQEARDALERGIAIAREVGEPLHEGVSQMYRARIERLMGRLAEARLGLEVAEQLLRSAGSQLGLVLHRCEVGHLALAEGSSARPWISEALEKAAVMNAGPQGDTSLAIAKLESAQADLDGGRPLFQGERIEDLPEGLRLWLREAGPIRDTRL